MTAAATMMTNPSTLSDEEVGRDAGDQQRQSDEESDAGQGRAAAVDPADPGPAQRVDQLGVLGGQRRLHLLEEPLLLL